MGKDNQYNDNNGQKWVDIPSFMNNDSEVNKPSAKPRHNVYEYDDSSDFVKEVNSSLAKQVSYDMDRRENTTSRKRRGKKRSHKGIKVLFFSLMFLIVVAGLLVFTPAGKNLIASIATEYIYGNLNYQSTDKPDVSTPLATDTQPTDKIVNILLIGVEEINHAQNTDSMMIATMNTQHHTLKLTSLMRDLYVDIPGHDPGRLNSAYAKGGIELLYDTIATNFGVRPDGYCKVNFDTFQQIVDMVGGVEVTLTSGEAHYLNTKNYISEKKYRNVVVGTQTLNGNQALGYCRVRKVSTSTESNDFGRTQRQRIVLKAIYHKIKKKNIVEQVILMNKILTEIKIDTDITKPEFRRYLGEAMSLKVKDLETLRIPTDGSYQNVTRKLGTINQEVLEPTDWAATQAQIHDFIYGTASGTETNADSETATGVKPDDSTDK